MADVSSRLQQLEQEKATLHEFVDRCAELGATDTDIVKHALEDQARIRAEMTPLSIEASELRTALAETRAALQQKWEPIHTAPADAHVNPVLLFWPYWSQEPVIGHHVNGEWWTDKWLGEDEEDPGPTHWMPLPDPPC